jgi:hypothetical protein
MRKHMPPPPKKKKPTQTHTGGGGGGAGKSGRGGANLSFERHVPKFLQPYAHMLASQAPQGNDEDAPQVVADRAAQRARREAEDDEDDDKAAEQVLCVWGPAAEALRR